MAESEKKFFTFSDVLEGEPPRTRNIIGKGLLPEGGIMCIFGAPQTFKSWMALGGTHQVGAGLPFLENFPVIRSPSVYVDGEMGWKRLWKRARKQAMYYPGAKGNVIYCSRPGLLLNTDEGFKRWMGELDQLRADGFNPSLITYDALRWFLKGTEKNDEDMHPFLLNCKKTGSSNIIIHHTRKVGKFFNFRTGEFIKPDLSPEDAIGSSVLWREVDTLIGVDIVRGDTIRVGFMKVRDAEEFLQPIELRFSRTKGILEHGKATIEDLIVEKIRNNGHLSPHDLLNTLVAEQLEETRKLTQNKLRDILNNMYEQGHIVIEGSTKARKVKLADS